MKVFAPRNAAYFCLCLFAYSVVSVSAPVQDNSQTDQRIEDLVDQGYKKWKSNFALEEQFLANGQKLPETQTLPCAPPDPNACSRTETEAWATELSKAIQIVPIYPLAAKEKKESGRAVIRATMCSTSIKPNKVELIQSTGSPLLDLAAIQATVFAVLSPAVCGGKKTTISADTSVEFLVPE